MLILRYLSSIGKRVIKGVRQGCRFFSTVTLVKGNKPVFHRQIWRPRIGTKHLVNRGFPRNDRVRQANEKRHLDGWGWWNRRLWWKWEREAVLWWSLWNFSVPRKIKCGHKNVIRSINWANVTKNTSMPKIYSTNRFRLQSLLRFVFDRFFQFRLSTYPSDIIRKDRTRLVPKQERLDQIRWAIRWFN